VKKAPLGMAVLSSLSYRESVIAPQMQRAAATPSWLVTLIRVSLGLAVVGFVAGCTAAPLTQTQGAVPPGSLSGEWKGSNGGLRVSLDLEQRGDSVTGSGTYQVTPGASVGCGGETIPASGGVSLTGSLAAGVFQGHMSLGGVWIPPYLGTLKTPDSLDAHFMSVDRGGCTLPLVRQH
jgi:hypothetical protein